MTYFVGCWLLLMVHLRVIYGNNLYGETEWQKILVLTAFFFFMTFYSQHKARIADPGTVKPKSEGPAAE